MALQLRWPSHGRKGGGRVGLPQESSPSSRYGRNETAGDRESRRRSGEEGGE